MRKYFILAALIFSIAAVSCKKFNNSDQPVSKFTFVSNIDIAESFSLAISAEEKLLAVKLTPEKASIKDNLNVTCDQSGESVISYYLTDKGIAIKPLSIGQAKLSVSVRSGDAEPKECRVYVTETPPDPKTITVVKSSNNFIDGRLCLVKDASYKLQAEVINVQMHATDDFNILWTIDEGSGVIDLAADGTVTAKVDEGTARVKASVEDFPAVSTTVEVRLMPAPTDLSINTSLNPDGELIIKKGTEVSVGTTISPSGSIGVIEAESDKPEFASVSISGSAVKIKGNFSSKDPVTITVTSPYNSNISKTLTVYVFDYDAADAKPGDYVYSNGSLFQSKDGGFRLRTSSGEMIYQDAEGRRKSTPKNFPGSVLGGTGTYKFIGVVASPTAPSDEDFMGCGYLANCKDGSNATGLYEYRTFRKSNLPGLNGSHVLVLSCDQSALTTYWQESTEGIARSTDKTEGIYQSQLYNFYSGFYFSMEELNYWINWTNERYEPEDLLEDLDFRYCACGLVSHLDLLFYSKHVRNSSYQVIPVMTVDALTGIAKISSWSGGSAKSSTGWFLPGYLEWMYIGTYLPMISNALASSSSPALDGRYWSTEEESATRVFCYEVKNNSLTRLGGDGKEIWKRTDQARTRAVLYL